MKKVIVLCCLVFAAYAGFSEGVESGENIETEGGVPAEDDFDPEEGDDFFDFGEDEGITVTGTHKTTAQEKVVPKDEIDRIAAPDLPTLLEEALDINITRHGAYGNSSDINIRGFSTERIAILVDGVPVNSAMSGDFDFNSINMNNIDRIEVIYGGSDTRYNVSGALGGVVNIITVKDQKPGLRFGAGIMNTSYMPGKYTEWNGTKETPKWEDLVDTQRLTLSLSYGAENFSWGFHSFADRAQNHYLFKDSFLGKVRRKQCNEVWDLGGGALFKWNFSNLSKLVFSADVYYSDKNIPAQGFSSVTGVQNDIITRESLMYDMPVAFRDDLSAELTLSHSWARLDYDRLGMTFSRHDQQGLTAINRWGWYPSEVLTLRTGWDYRYIHLDSTGIGSRNRHDGGIYLTAEISPVKKFIIIPSIKTVTDGSRIVPIPKLGFVWCVIR
jgi:vitamin B12 transporter